MLAVLTGDLVDSTRLTTEHYEQTISGLRELFKQISSQTGCEYELYRGDGFQLVFAEPRKAIAQLFTIRLYLNSQLNSIAVNCTLSLAYGEGALNGSGPGTSTGEVFIQSGRGLDNCRGGEFTVIVSQQDKQPAISIMCAQLSYVLNRLSKKQADLLYQYLTLGFPVHQVLADNNSTSRQNISERLKAAGGDLLAPFIDYINAQQDQAL